MFIQQQQTFQERKPMTYYVYFFFTFTALNTLGDTNTAVS